MKTSFTESDLWKKLDDILNDVGHAVRHEDRMSPGTPDVSYGLRHVNGWIELKAYGRWPQDPDAVVPFRNLKPQQRRFLHKRWKSGGHTFVMASFGREILLISAASVLVLGQLTKRQLLQRTDAHWPSGTIDREQLLSFLGPEEGQHVGRSVRSAVRIRPDR